MSDQDFRNEIAKQLAELSGVTIDQALEVIEPCKRIENGDYSIPIPKLNRFKKLSGRPNELAQLWASKFVVGDLIKKVEFEATFINITANKSLIIKRLFETVFEEKERYGSSNAGQGKNIVVEFSSPNIAKPFHAGHLRSTIIGNVMQSLYRFTGHNVTSINYLGDWGKQYGLLAVAFNRFGNREELKADPIKHLFQIYVKINDVKKEEEKVNSTATDDEARAYFRRMEDGDKDALSLWNEFRSLSIEEYKKMYQRLNVHFDVYSGESMFGEAMVEEVKKLEDSKLLHEDKGAMIVDLEAEKLGKALIKKSDGATLYITRDIAAARTRHDIYNFDKLIYVVASQQTLHFQQLFTILGKMGYEWTKDCVHISFGMVKGMSTRDGTVVFLTDILDKAADAMKEVMQKDNNKDKYAQLEDPIDTANKIGLSSVVVQDLSARRIKDYSFDWERMTSFEGDTGPYLQYSHARLCSMQRKAVSRGIELKKDVDVSLLVEKEANEVVALVSRFSDNVNHALLQMEPCVLVTYLFNLCHSISTAIEKVRLLVDDKNLAEARLALYWCAKTTLGNGLRLIGLTPLERM